MARVNENPPPQHQPDFAEAWHEIAPAVRRSLSGAPAHVAEDVLQETGIKLMRAWDSIDHSRPALPLAVTIARNTLRDELRKMTRHAHLELSEEHRVADDLDARVSARIELSRVEAELARLTPGQRSALLMEVGGGSRAADSPKIKMLRARARARLRELVAQAGGFVAAGAARLRAVSVHRAAGVMPDLGLLAQALLLAFVATNVAAPALREPRERPRRNLAQVAVADGSAPASARVTSRAAGTAPVAAAAPEGEAPAGVRPQRSGGSAPGSGGSAPGSGGGILPGVPVPHSKGEAGESGHFGADGYDLEGGGETSAAGRPVVWQYEGEWESPGCVQRLAEGQALGTCSVPERPSGSVTAEVDGHQVRVGPRRR